MKVAVSRDELYPVFVVTRNEEHWDFEVELSEEEGEFVKKARQDFDKAQNILQAAYEKAAKEAAK